MKIVTIMNDFAHRSDGRSFACLPASSSTMSSTWSHHQISEVLKCREGASGPPAPRRCGKRPGPRRPQTTAREPLAVMLTAAGADRDPSRRAGHTQNGRAPASAAEGAGGAEGAADVVFTYSACKIRTRARIWLHSMVRATRIRWFINSEGRHVSESYFLQKIFRIDVLGVSKRLKRTWP